MGKEVLWGDDYAIISLLKHTTQLCSASLILVLLRDNSLSHFLIIVHYVGHILLVNDF